MYSRVSREFAKAYYHWFFLLRPEPIPETLIGANPDFYLESHIGTRHAGLKAFTPEALAEYRRCFRDPAAIHASCEDYRAAESIDLQHDEADISRKLAAPLLVLWGKHGTIERCFKPLADWAERAESVQGRALDCGHWRGSCRLRCAACPPACRAPRPRRGPCPRPCRSRRRPR